MAISLGDALLKLGVDKSEFDKAMRDTESTVRNSMQNIQTGLKVAGAAFTAVGVAGLKMVSDAKQMNAQLGQTALTLGVTTAEMRDLALSTTDVTFPLKSVSATFELLARAGVRNTEVMQQNAKAFDALADATGLEAEVVADLLLPAFKLFGEEIPTTSAELDKFTWLTKNTLVDLSDFGTLLTRMAPYMDTLNLSMDDAIVTLAALGEQGITGTAATLKLRTAITQAASSGQDLTKVLGISETTLDKFRKQMEGATGITDKYAKVANTQFTIIDKLKQKFSELSLTIGTTLEPFEGLLGAMTVLGPLMISLSYAIKAVASAQWLLNAAMLANPIGVVVIAVGALAAIALILWKNWDKVREGWVDLWRDRRQISEAEKRLAEEETERLRKQLIGERDMKKANLDADQNALRKAHDSKIADLEKTYGILAREDEEYTNDKIGFARKATDEQRKQYDKDLTNAQRVYDAKIKLIEDEYDWRIKIVDNMAAAQIANLQKQITVLDKQTEAEDKALTEQGRERRLAELDAAIDAAKTAEDREQAIRDRRDYENEIIRERLREVKQEQKDILREEIDRIRTTATTERDRLKEELDQKKRHETALYNETEERLKLERDALDGALKAELLRLDTERIATEKMEKAKLDAMLDRLEKQKEALDRYYGTINVGGGVGKVPYGPALPTTIELPEMQHGGIIREPTLLYGLKSMRPYAVAGEAGIEHVVPGGRAGYQSANIFVQLDGRTLAQAIGQPLVDLIRIRTGVRV